MDIANATTTKLPTELIGRTYGRLTIQRIHRGKGSRLIAGCVCECGKLHECRVDSLKAGTTTSCGCLWNIGAEKRPEYWILAGMKQRCYDVNHKFYHRYGGRGIEVCERWRGHSGFVNFLADMGPRPSPKHSIDRINNDGNYEPGNCRWATKEVQSRNTSQAVVVTYAGASRTLSEWARVVGMNQSALCRRLRRGWSFEKAITTPLQQHGRSTDGSSGVRVEVQAAGQSQ